MLRRDYKEGIKRRYQKGTTFPLKEGVSYAKYKGILVPFKGRIIRKPWFP
jgi:hypothetical protein